jgi:hypothetical protein
MQSHVATSMDPSEVPPGAATRACWRRAQYLPNKSIFATCAHKHSHWSNPAFSATYFIATKHHTQHFRKAPVERTLSLAARLDPASDSGAP